MTELAISPDTIEHMRVCMFVCFASVCVDVCVCVCLQMYVYVQFFVHMHVCVAHIH